MLSEFLKSALTLQATKIEIISFLANFSISFSAKLDADKLSNP